MIGKAVSLLPLRCSFFSWANLPISTGRAVISHSLSCNAWSDGNFISSATTAATSMLMFLLTWILSARVFPMNWIHVLSGKS